MASKTRRRDDIHLSGMDFATVFCPRQAMPPVPCSALPWLAFLRGVFPDSDVSATVEPGGRP